MPIFEHTYYTAKCSICNKIDGKYKTKDQAEKWLNTYHEDNCSYNLLAKKCKTCVIRDTHNIFEYMYGDYEYLQELYYCIHGDKAGAFINCVNDDDSCPNWSNTEDDKITYNSQEINDIAHEYELRIYDNEE